MIIKCNELPKIECRFSDVNPCIMHAGSITLYDYEKEGRQKHLLFYQTENERHYTRNGELIATIAPKDVIFLPHGAKYLSSSADTSKVSGGIVVSFVLHTIEGEPILFDENDVIVKHDHDGRFLSHFKNLRACAVNPAENTLRICGELSVLLDEMFSDKDGQNGRDKAFKDIKTAVRTIEREPWRDLTVSELAALCCMSESTFLRTFKHFSGGISPIKYRNNIRLMLAEELAASKMTLDEIAERLGFYDAAHLCNLYRKYKGKRLKK